MGKRKEDHLLRKKAGGPGSKTPHYVGTPRTGIRCPDTIFTNNKVLDFPLQKAAA